MSDSFSLLIRCIFVLISLLIQYNAPDNKVKVMLITTINSGMLMVDF